MAIIVITYIVISSPFDKMVSPFEDLNMSASDAQLEVASGYAKTVFNMSFGMLAIFPTAWFIFWTFRREPDWGYNQ